MPDYIQDPDNNKRVVPGPNQYHDRPTTPERFAFHKTPNAVLVNVANTSANGIGFFFGSSASFAEKITVYNNLQGEVPEQNTLLSASAPYVDFGQPAAGTILPIHPTAWSGSAADSVVFIYKGGPDGSGRP